MAVKIVTDSTSDLPPEIAERFGIEVVPLNVHFGDQTFKDGVDLSADEFYERLITGGILPRTSQPSPGEFMETYDEVGRDADAIVSIHISAKLSGTYNSALQGMQQVSVECPIQVVDSQQASLGLGMVALVAARVANDGGTLDEVADAAREASGRAECFTLLDTLEYLEKGGRIGKASGMLGTLLRIKPLLMIRDGEVHELAKERTSARALARLETTAIEFAPVEELCVLYSTVPDDAMRIAENLKGILPEGKEPLVSRLGPVMGTYTGPRSVGVSLLRT